MTTIALHRMNRFWLTTLLDGAGRTVHAWRERNRGRAQLARMSEYELKDIGLSRTAAAFEANKPFWRA